MNEGASGIFSPRVSVVAVEGAGGGEERQGQNCRELELKARN